MAARIPTTVLLSADQRAAIDDVKTELSKGGLQASLGDAIRFVMDRGVASIKNTDSNRGHSAA